MKTEAEAWQVHTWKIFVGLSSTSRALRQLLQCAQLRRRLFNLRRKSLSPKGKMTSNKRVVHQTRSSQLAMVAAVRKGMPRVVLEPHSWQRTL